MIEKALTLPCGILFICIAFIKPFQEVNTI